MKSILIYSSVMGILAALIILFIEHQRGQERLAGQGHAVRQIVLAALSYPSGSVMEWPSDIPQLIKWSEGELDFVPKVLNLSDLAYPRPDGKGYAIQPAVVYKTRNMMGDRFIVGYCNGDVAVLRNSKIFDAAKELDNKAIGNKVISLEDWQQFIPDMKRR